MTVRRATARRHNGMQVNCSQQLAKAFHLRLPADLTSWLDDDIWRTPGAVFCRPRSPTQLLEPEQGSIWAGFMLPDTLPLISNAQGDWLCLRVAADGGIAEVVFWCHAGGDWMPYGRSLSEALIYDAAFPLLYPRAATERSDDDDSKFSFAAAEWAWSWTRLADARPAPRFWQQPLRSRRDLLEQLIAAHVAEVAARRDLILSHLESQLKIQSEPAVAAHVGAPWEPDFVSWLFDTALIPDLTRNELSHFFRLSSERLLVQDWHAAEQEALRVVALRNDLEWPFDIAGWAAERRGDVAAAVTHYVHGARASAFSDHSVSFRTHWFPEGLGKFSAARLFLLRDQLPDHVRSDPYLQIFWENDSATLRNRVRDYWFASAAAAERRQHWIEAYRCYYAAGWDCGLNQIAAYADILDRLATTAERAGAAALSAVAALHRRHLPV
jgi:hypothetical protein